MTDNTLWARGVPFFVLIVVLVGVGASVTPLGSALGQMRGDVAGGLLSNSIHISRVTQVEKTVEVSRGHSLVWPVGECTYWANLRYYELTGWWVPWRGDAWEWGAGAKRFGWNVSSEPRAPSIIVLMPGVQGASSIGHVAVVESLLSPTTVETSDMNWNGWNVVRNVEFRAGPGVWFVWR